MNLNYEKVTVKYDGELEKNKSRIVIEPLEKGYSRVLAVPLRNVLLSSMPGAAVVGVKIDGVKSEMAKIEGSTNDMIELILNLKEIKFRTEKEEIQVLTFKSKKEGYYTSNDIKLIDGVEMATPDKELIALDGTKEVDIEIYIKKGRGYVESVNHKELITNEEYKDVVKVDGMFTPIKKVGYKTEEIRVGQSEDFERFVLEIETDGSMEALEAVGLASKIVTFHFNFFEDMQEVVDDYELNKQEEIQEENRILEQSIGMLDLSVRSYNCLKKENVETIKDLCELTFMGLKSIEHLGKKSLEEILEKIEALGLSLKQE